MSKSPHADSRATILGRIREARTAVGIPAGRPAPPNGGRDALPSPHADSHERISAFAQHMEELGVSFVLCDDRADVAEGLNQFAKRSAWKSVSALKSPGLADLLKTYPGTLVWSDAACDLAHLAAVDVAIVEADALDAQFGSILCAATPGGLELVSLAPALVVIATMGKLCADLTAAYELLARQNGGALPAGFTSLTGLAANQAIERKRISRGHGPQTLTVFLAPS